MSGCWQVELDPLAREKSPFTTHAGLFEFNTLLFGPCNAPSMFQRLMKSVLWGLTWQIALIYLDNVLVYSSTFKEHLKHLCLVFDPFREAGLRLNPNKAAGTHYIPRQWPLFWPSSAMHWPVIDYIWYQALCFEKQGTGPMFLRLDNNFVSSKCSDDCSSALLAWFTVSPQSQATISTNPPGFLTL